MYLQDAALHEAVRREGAGWAHDDLIAFGKLVGAADYRALGALANRPQPPDWNVEWQERRSPPGRSPVVASTR